MTALGWICVAFAVLFWWSVINTKGRLPGPHVVVAFACSLGALGLAYLCFRAVACG